MSATVWKGHIAFGLVSFPVKLHAAARNQAISFHQLHQSDRARVRQVLYCQAEDRPVARAELIKGFAYDKDRYVVVEDRELDQMAPPSSRVMEVREFVPAAEVDPVYLDASYYSVPETAGEKPYTLLYQALRRSGYAALAQWTWQNREYLVLLRPGRYGLLLHTLFYADEVRALEEFRTEVEWVTPRELEPAGLLVESLAVSITEKAFIQSQRREGWIALPDRYDDGGFTGANMDRPALQRLLTAVEAGEVRRTYLGLVHGNLADAGVRVLGFLSHDESRPLGSWSRSAKICWRPCSPASTAATRRPGMRAISAGGIFGEAVSFPTRRRRTASGRRCAARADGRRAGGLSVIKRAPPFNRRGRKAGDRGVLQDLYPVIMWSGYDRRGWPATTASQARRGQRGRDPLASLWGGPARWH